MGYERQKDILMKAGQAGSMTIASLVAFAEVSGCDLVIQFIDKKKSPLKGEKEIALVNKQMNKGRRSRKAKP